MLFGAPERQYATVVAFQILLHHHPIHLADAHNIDFTLKSSRIDFLILSSLVRFGNHEAMKIATIIVRILLGLVFVFFGSNFFFHFIPTPPPPPGLVGDYIKVFVASGYASVICAMQLPLRLMLPVGRFVPLALTILGGIIFNILLFHILMAKGGIGPV